MARIVNENGSISSIAPTQMKFPEAMHVLISSAHKIRRASWQDESEYCVIQDGWLKIHKATGRFHEWLVNDGDMYADDWVIVPDGAIIN